MFSQLFDAPTWKHVISVVWFDCIEWLNKHKANVFKCQVRWNVGRGVLSYCMYFLFFWFHSLDLFYYHYTLSVIQTFKHTFVSLMYLADFSDFLISISLPLAWVVSELYFVYLIFHLFSSLLFSLLEQLIVLVVSDWQLWLL